ncbi:MAG: sugar phosphate isomerase/epimerase family protein, partial [Bryobacteraceae bacterium]
MTRRTFLTAAAAAPVMLQAAPQKPVLCIFSKHMAQFNYDELGRHAREIGFDGVDLTVRPKGHVLPERAKEDLPRAVEAIRGHKLEVPMITTGITSPSDPATRPILSTAAQLNIPYWKPGYFRYAPEQDVVARIEEVKQTTAQLASLSEEYGIAAGFHNHSGDYVGSAVWDIRWIIRDLDPRWIGYYYDPAHATVEGGLAGWRISQNIASKRLKMVALKDFYWSKGSSGWKVEWCPIGEGMVNWPKVFAAFAKSGFSGPLTLHVEYHAKDELEAIAKDYEFIRKQIAAAYSSPETRAQRTRAV